MLSALLDFHRATPLWKIEGLIDEEIRRPLVPLGNPHERDDGQLTEHSPHRRATDAEASPEFHLGRQKLAKFQFTERGLSANLYLNLGRNRRRIPTTFLHAKLPRRVAR
jgi:hypothetical protein